MRDDAQDVSLNSTLLDERYPFAIRHKGSSQQLVEVLLSNGDSRKSLELLADQTGKSVLLKNSRFYVRADTKGDPLIFSDQLPSDDPSAGRGIFLVTDSSEQTALLAKSELERLRLDHIAEEKGSAISMVGRFFGAALVFALVGLIKSCS